jgi:hypothetical protein
LILAGCFNGMPGSPNLVDISVIPPTKTVYAIGDAFSPAGLAVIALYDDGSSAAVTAGWTLSWAGGAVAEGNLAITAEAGTKTVTLTYEGKTFTFAITVSAPGDTTAPAEAAALEAAAGDRRVTLTWTDPADGDLASLEIAWTPGGGSASVPGGIQTYTAAGLTNGTAYIFMVKAKDAAGNLSGGTGVTATPADATPPAKVTGLEAAAGNSRVTLTWIDPADVDLASLEIAWTPGGGSASVPRGIQTYTAAGLTNGTAYTFTVKAKDSAGNLSGGETAAASPDASSPSDLIPPGKVSALAAAGGDRQATLTWTDPADADLAFVEITWEPGGTTPQVAAKGIQTYTAVGLANGTLYTFTVKAKDNAGNLSQGETAAATPADTTPPAKVTGLGTAGGDGTVRLDWTDPADADLASVEIAWTPGGGSASVSKGTRTYTATGLTNGTAYTFTVKAKDAAGNLSGGETAAATPADTTPPAKVTGLGATGGDGTARLDWTDPADADLASVEIAWTPGGGSASVSKGTGTYIATGLVNGTAHTFTVKAKDAAGNLSGGETAAATPADTTPPAKVTGLEAAAGDGRVTLTWTDPADTDLASVEIAWTPGGGSASVSKGTRTYTATGLANGTAYTFTVKAKDNAGNLSGGETAAATPADTTPPAKVTGLGAARGNGMIRLDWTDPADADLKEIEIAWTPGGTTPQRVSKGSQTYIAADLTNDTGYTFTVKAKDAAGNLSGGETVTETPDASSPSDLIPPGLVSALTAVSGDRQISLTWTDPADTDLDHIEITWTPGGTTPQTVAKGAGTYTAMGLDNGTDYAFTVKAVDNAAPTPNSSKGKTTNATPTAAARVDVNFTGLPQDETIILSGVQNLSRSAGAQLTVTVSGGTFTAYRWALDGEALASETGNSLTLDAGSLAVKRHELTVFVTAGGVEYAKAVKFTVTN